MTAEAPAQTDIDGIWRGHAGFGVTNVEHPLPVDGDTLFQIGSITKTFTATALMRLVEQGAISFDAPVRIPARPAPRRRGPSRSGSRSVTC